MGCVPVVDISFGYNHYFLSAFKIGFSTFGSVFVVGKFCDILERGNFTSK